MVVDPGRFEPIHDAHAIEQAVLAIQIDKVLDDVRIRAAVDLIQGRFGNDFSVRGELQSFAVAFGPLPAPVGPNRSPFGGTVFSKAAHQGGLIESQLRMDRTSIVFQTTVYTRWDDVWGRVRNYLATALPIYAEEGHVVGINLNFQDKFYWVGDLSVYRPSRLLRAGSKYVCPHVYDAEDLWHSHTGIFLRADEQTKRLLNVNLDALDESTPQGPRRVVAITTGLTDQMNQLGYDAFDMNGDNLVGFINQRIPALHEFSKQTFKNVISDDMCARIGLE
jgi:uncharacterized protein (TIGR04255 family)